MGEAASRNHDGTGQHGTGQHRTGQHRTGRRRRARKGAVGSSDLTPPGMPALPAELGTGGPTQRSVVDPCVCGHSRQAHEHYRPGADCGACGRRGCGEYRPQNGRPFLRGTGPSG